jgi:hypothetical protein
MKGAKTSARDHYRREKERRAKKGLPETDLMAAARAEYQALLAAQATKGKGGRPKKKVAKPVVADLDEDLDEVTGDDPGDDAGDDEAPDAEEEEAPEE